MEGLFLNLLFLPASSLLLVSGFALLTNFRLFLVFLLILKMLLGILLHSLYLFKREYNLYNRYYLDIIYLLILFIYLI